MARSHKYIKRTGAPGSYKYWYKLPDGRIVEGDPDQQEHGKKDHARRLLVARAKGHHAMDNGKIAEEVGVTAARIREHISNLRQKGRAKHAAAGGSGDAMEHGHDYEEHHLHEGHKSPSHPDYETHTRAAEGSAAVEPERPSRRGGSRRRTAEVPADERHEVASEAPSQAASTPASEPSGESPEQVKAKMREAGFLSSREGGWNKHVTGGSVQVKLNRESGKWEVEGTDQPKKELRTLAMAIRHADQMGGKIEEAHSANRARQEADEAPPMNSAPEETPGQREQREAAERIAPRRAARRAARETAEAAQAELASVPAAAPAETAAQRTARESEEQLEARRARLRAVGHYPTADAARARAQESAARVAGEQAQAAMRSSSPSSTEARELASVDPSFAEADRPITEMLEAQRRGENPYLKRATDIYHNIRGDVKDERKQTIDHVFSALAALKTAGKPLTEENVVNKYKELSGKRIRGISGIAEEFEKGTFMQLEEVMNNHPVNVEVERMKRGYAAKQFARMKPFLKGEWTAANPSAPPPYPTFGDIKSWGDHGGTRPSWAGSTRLAMPKEVFDASIKDAAGKPQYPPPWMPIHLMPVWNYAAKKAAGEGNNPYQSGNVATNQRGMVDRTGTGSQAQYQEGMLKSAIRKYVVMRGGAENLTDIPANKLSEAGLSHGDIFKSEEGKEMSDEQLNHLVKHKIVDPVGLMKFVKEEMKAKTQKSWALVVDLQKGAVDFKKEPAIPFKKSFVVRRDDVRKSKIEKVRSLLREKARS